MTYFAIIEVDDGMTIVEYQPGDDLISIAEARGGTVVDPGPFRNYEEAYDELLNLEPDVDDRED